MNGPESERGCPAQPRAAYYEQTLTSTALELWADEVTVPVAGGHHRLPGPLSLEAMCRLGERSDPQGCQGSDASGKV